MNIEVNYLSVLAAAASSMVLGFLWYSPYVLGKPWMKAMGYTMEGLKKEQSKMGPYYGLSFLVAVITAYVLYHVMVMSENYFHYEMLQTGITSAFWMWFGFMMPVQLTGEIFGEKNWRLFAINTSHQLASLLVMGAILAKV